LNRKKVEIPKGRIRFDRLRTEEEIEQVQIELDQYFVEQMVSANRDALFCLFPKAKGRNPIKISSDDIDGLKDSFVSLIQVVHDDRNRHRAHKFEKDQGRAYTEQLGFAKLKVKFNEVEHILNNLRLVITNSSFASSDMNLANKTEVARDLVTMFLWGSNKTIDTRAGINSRLNVGVVATLDFKYGYQLRDNLISESHAYHSRIMEGDLRPEDANEKSGGEFCFNDVSIDRVKEKEAAAAKSK
jgi:hypothetical protein